MGIRFYCPNGHKLNVKTFLAGKRGICPHCHARFEIPQESQVAEDAPKIRPSNPSLGQPAAAPVPAATASRAAAGQTEVDGSQEVAREPNADPISEAPEAVWYVRLAAGDQYGPARGEVMRQWIAEGRVSTDSMVWREGWAEWKRAGQVFSSLSSGLPTVAEGPALDVPELPPAVAGDVAPLEGISRAELLKKKSAKRTPKTRRSIAVVVALGVLIVLLLAVLFFVLENTG